MSLLIGPGTVVTMTGTVLEGGAVLTEGSRIVAVGAFKDLQHLAPEASLVEAGGGLITPGLVNAHTHFYGLFARGMALKDPSPETFRQILERLWWRLDKALDEKGVYLSAMLGGIAALRSGCTTVVDHHASPNAIAGSLDLVAEATETLGLRACLCYEVSDRDGPERAAAGIAENARFLERTADKSGRLTGLFGLHASFTVGDRTMAAAREAALAAGAGLHLHCAEGPEDGADSRNRYGRSVVERLHAQGLLGPDTILGHCVHISDSDMDLLAATGTRVSHQPHSNMGNAVGWGRLLHMQERGVPVLLGTDGYNWDMLETMRTAAAMNAHMTGTPGAGVAEFARVLLTANADLVTRLYGAPAGRLEPGALADLVIWDYDPPTPLTEGNLPWHLQFGMGPAQVRTVLVNGRVVLQDRVLPGIDEALLAAEARTTARATWERF